MSYKFIVNDCLCTVCYVVNDAPLWALAELFSLLPKSLKHLVIGDFNFCARHMNDGLQGMLTELGIMQLNNRPTMMSGRVLDHVYVSVSELKVSFFLHSTYISDHDAICINLCKT